MLARITAVFLATVSLLAAAPALPFKDDFARFPSADWKTHGGEWTAEKGELRVSGEAGPKASIAGLQAGDFQLDVELRAEADGAQAGVIFRADELADGVDA